MEFLGVFEPKHRPLSAMSRDEIEAMADEMYDYLVEKLAPTERPNHRKARRPDGWPVD